MFHDAMPMMNCGMRRLPGLRLAECRGLGSGVLLIACLAAGCAHSQKHGGRAGAAGGMLVPQPPAFLDGPMALLLTNVDGFRARVVLEGGTTARGSERIVGELLGRGGKLVFAPGSGSAARKQPPAAGAAFVWDVAGNSGYMLNDPLQAYAPISANRQFTNITVSAAISNSAPERVAGHPCQPTEVTVAASDGSATVCRTWRATDLKGFPMRITCASNGTLLTLSLSNVRLETLPGDLFRPPNDFTKYNSAQALINELDARQQDLKRRPAYYGTDQNETLGGPEVRQPSRPQ
jgi:hypothetical protein